MNPIALYPMVAEFGMAILAIDPQAETVTAAWYDGDQPSDITTELITYDPYGEPWFFKGGQHWYLHKFYLC